MSSDYVSTLEERAAKLWGVISQLESRRIAELEKFALTDDEDAAAKAIRFQDRIAAAETALAVINRVLEAEGQPTYE